MPKFVPMPCEVNSERTKNSHLEEKITHTVYATKFRAKNLVVPVEIAGRTLKAVVDTAAQVTVLNQNLLTEFLADKESKTATLKGIGQQEISAEQFDKIPMSVGNKTYSISIFTTEIKEDMLLGIDFLNKFGVEIDFSRCQLTIGQEKIQAFLLRDSELKHHTITRVVTSRRVRLDAQTVSRVPISLDKKFDETFVFTPASDSTTCMMSCTLNSPGDVAIVQLINDTDSPVDLKSNTVIGSAIAGEVLNRPRHRDSRSVRATKHVTNRKYKFLPEHLKDLYERSIVHLNDDEKFRLKLLLVKFGNTFSKDELDLGHFKDLKHTIQLEAGAIPVKESLRRTASKFEGEEEKNLNAMLNAGVIQPSSSPWSSASVLVRKKCGGVRWCQDFRKLNKMTVKDAFPLPLISDCYDCLQGNKFMSSLDLASGYWQMEIAPEDREKTAFITKYGLYEYVRMSMGLCNAPSTFQRAMNLVLRGLTWKSVLAFLDDVMVLGKTFEEHLANLEEVLERFQHHNLKLKPKKCALFQTQTKFLGRIVTGETVSVDPASVEVVRDWPTPTCTKDVERFLGFANYNRDHIPSLAELADPLYGLTGKNPFIWSELHEDAFGKIKEALLKPVTLSLPTPDDAFILDVDASNIAVAAQLSQLRDGTEVPISYGSKALTPAQRKYCATRKELLALIVFTRQFRHYLLGRPFIVRTDHSSLLWLTNFRYIQGQLARWLEELQQFNMQVIHRKGKLHINSDSLSRVPDNIPFCTNYEASADVDSLPCGGCKYCKRAQTQWGEFESEVDDVIPLGVPIVRTVGLGSNWADILSPHLKTDKQKEDSDLRKCFDWLLNPPSPETVLAESPTLRILWDHRNQLTVDNDVLFYNWETSDGGKRRLFVVPQGLKNMVLRLAHDNTLAGHFGQKKTFERISRLLYWPNMRADINEYVRSCYACNRSKHLRRRYRAPLQELTMGYPMDKVHIDIMGPLPRSNRGNCYVLVMVCQFSKWVEIAALPDQQAETVARAMIDNLISRFGCPRLIFSDQGSNFIGGLFTELCERLGIEKKRTTAYHASANGQVERLNRVLGQAIRAVISSCEKTDQTTWDERLQLIAGAIRSTLNRSTGFTPNKLMLGREVTQPLELLLGIEHREEATSEYVKALEEDMRVSHEAARTALKSEQKRRKKDYSVSTYETSYEVGDAVLLANSATKIGQCKKLKALWLGPFLIERKISPVLFQIASQKRSQIVHHDRLRPCRDRSVPLWIYRKREELEGVHNILDETLGSFADEPLYCYCRKPYDDTRLMVGCDGCGDWFHVDPCVGLTEEEVDDMEKFFCKACCHQQ